MKRISHLLNTVRTRWSDDPAARGAAKMAAGALLVAEGTFGVLRSGNGKSKGGLFGGLVGVVVGTLFVVIGFVMAPEKYEDPVTTPGTVVDVETGRGSDGDTMYKPTYGFEFDGREYRFEARMRTNQRSSVGDAVEITHSAADPSKAHRSDGLVSKAHWLFIGAGGLVAVASLFSLVVSVALIVFGVLLFGSGRTDRRSADSSGNFFGDLMSIVGRARAGQIDIEATAAGTRGSSQGEATERQG